MPTVSRGREAGVSAWQLHVDGAAWIDAAGISWGPMPTVVIQVALDEPTAHSKEVSSSCPAHALLF